MISAPIGRLPDQASQAQEAPVSFQAYLDNVEAKTGKTPQQFVDEAAAKGLTQHGEILAWLKEDYGLGTGHARAIAHVIVHGPEFELKQTSGTHRDKLRAVHDHVRYRACVTGAEPKIGRAHV